MKHFCPKCGLRLEDNVKFCSRCGFDLQDFANRQTVSFGQQNPPGKPPQTPAQANAPGFTPPTQNSGAAPMPPTQGQGALPPTQYTAAFPAPPAVNGGMPPVTNQYFGPIPPPPVSQTGKKKKKKKLPFIIRFPRNLLILCSILFLLWYGVGNTVTLYFHSETVVETLNSGSLELPGTENAYSELPNYVKDMLDEEHMENKHGPMTQAVLPYIRVERINIDGYFGSSTVTYKITAPDIESWLLNLDANLVTSEQELLSMLKQYIPTAPERSVEVTVEYDREGFFSTDWKGNYYTREFADAVCGGFNSAYNVLVEEVMKEYAEVEGQ